MNQLYRGMTGRLDYVKKDPKGSNAPSGIKIKHL